MQIVLDVSEFQAVTELDQCLTNADDEIVGVYIKATQGLDYTNPTALDCALCCTQHNTPFGYYAFLTNDQIDEQQADFKAFTATLPAASLIPMLDCEGSYDKYAAGVTHWAGPKIIYAQLSNMPDYASLLIPKWVAQYDQTEYYRPQPSEIAAYKQQGYTLWQWTDRYMNRNQDASVLVGDFSALKAT
jgi:GH25 family lysozyme M1 (1,4-beta-N-acetylmuramidase)